VDVKGQLLTYPAFLLSILGPPGVLPNSIVLAGVTDHSEDSDSVGLKSETDSSDEPEPTGGAVSGSAIFSFAGGYDVYWSESDSESPYCFPGVDGTSMTALGLVSLRAAILSIASSSSPGVINWYRSGSTSTISSSRSDCVPDVL
jgi:hypothetical protein